MRLCQLCQLCQEDGHVPLPRPGEVLWFETTWDPQRPKFKMRLCRHHAEVLNASLVVVEPFTRQEGVLLDVMDL